MDTLPLSQKIVTVHGRLGEQPPHVRGLDAGTEDELRPATGARQIDFPVPWSGDMDMCWFVVERDEPEAVRAVDDDHDADVTI